MKTKEARVEKLAFSATQIDKTVSTPTSKLYHRGFTGISLFHGFINESETSVARKGLAHQVVKSIARGAITGEFPCNVVVALILRLPTKKKRKEIPKNGFY